jgi:pimeloyl-ACP methyl ester carboxylesterase
MASESPVREETWFLTCEDYKIFVKQTAAADDAKYPNVVVIAVHGGPGLNSHTELMSGLRPLTSIVESVVYYDQLGCGESESPSDASLYTLEYYVRELERVIENVRAKHAGKKIVLLGYSWGGQIVLEAALSGRQLPVDGCVISNAPLNEQTYSARQRDIRNALEEDLRRLVEEEEENAESVAYTVLIGTSDSNITGSMAMWSAIERLLDEEKGMSVPSLFIVGTHDTVPTMEYEQLRDRRLPGMRVLIIEDSDHAPFYSNHTKGVYFDTVDQFIAAL